MCVCDYVCKWSVYPLIQKKMVWENWLNDQHGKRAFIYKMILLSSVQVQDVRMHFLVKAYTNLIFRNKEQLFYSEYRKEWSELSNMVYNERYLNIIK